MMLKRLLRSDIRGIGAVEFALITPVLISFVIGIAQVGKLFYASADMKNALAAGARVASIWPVPDDPDILAAVNAQISRTGGVGAADVTIQQRGTDANGNNFVIIKMDYEVELDFIFFDAGPITLSDTRQVFTQMPGAAPPGNNGGGTTTGTTTSTTTGGTTTGGTTTGGSASTSTTSAGGTTSTSATSASSTGGTSATSASTTSTTSSTTSSSSNGNGNSNGNSGHGHGDCKKKC